MDNRDLSRRVEKLEETTPSKRQVRDALDAAEDARELSRNLERRVERIEERWRWWWLIALVALLLATWRLHAVVVARGPDLGPGISWGVRPP